MSEFVLTIHCYVYDWLVPVQNKLSKGDYMYYITSNDLYTLLVCALHISEEMVMYILQSICTCKNEICFSNIRKHTSALSFVMAYGGNGGVGWGRSLFLWVMITSGMRNYTLHVYDLLRESTCQDLGKYVIVK